MTFEKAVEMLDLKCPVTGEAISADELLETFKNDLEESVRRPGSWEAQKMSAVLSRLEYDSNDDPDIATTLEFLKSDVAVILDRPGSHEAIDEALLRQGRRIAEMIEDDPESMARIALENIGRWKRHDSICELHLVWERAIKAGKWMEIRRILIGRGERNRQFRQTMPFAETSVEFQKGRAGEKRTI